MEKLSAALLGATGMAGQQFIRFLDGHPYFELKVLTASCKNVGKTYREAAKWFVEGEMPAHIAEMTVLETSVDAVRQAAPDVKVVFVALPSGKAKECELECAQAGWHVFSDAGCFRLEPDIPVIIPEVNGDHLQLLHAQRRNRNWTGSIVKNPNCTITGAAMALKPLAPFGLKQVHLASMQAVSGAGYDGVYSMQILDNVIPYIAEEEEKVQQEALKLLGELNEDASAVRWHPMWLSASCHRVPTLYGHLEALFIEFEREVDLDEVKAALKNFRGTPQELKLPTAPYQPLLLTEDPFRPQTRLDRDAGEPDRARGMAAVVGRVRYDEAFREDGRTVLKNRIRLINLSHNTVRGASGNAVLTAELALRQGYVG